MPLGQFTLEIKGQEQDGTAETKARLHLTPQGPDTLLGDDDFKFPSKFAKADGVPISIPFDVDLFTDTASGEGDSVTIGYEGWVATDHDRVPFQFAAPEAGETLNLRQAVDREILPLSDLRIFRDEAQAAATAAAASATSVNREQSSGVAGLTAAGKLYEARIPDRLSEVALGATYDHRRDISYTQAQNRRAKPVEVRYRPTAVTNVATTSTAAGQRVDVTNLKATVVAPPSGRIRFYLEAGAIVDDASALRWMIRGASGSIANSDTIVHNNLTAADTGTIRYSSTGEISTDEGGAALVPGKEYVFYWGHICSVSGKTSYTCMGGVAGAAVMRFEPVEITATETPYTLASSGVAATVPLWLCHDRKTLLGTAASPWRVKWSVDAGATWTTNNGPSFGNNVQQLRETDDGEVLAFVNAVSGSNPTVWKSNGWATDHLTATWTQVLEQQGPTPSPSTGSWRQFSIDTHGPIVLAAEYGPKNGTADMARYLHCSEDYGATWRTIFDLADYETSTAHLHGVSYDPWWDAIWLTSGDDPGATKGEVAASWISFDRGETWTRLGLVHQCTTVYALPSCVLFVTDKGDPNCIWRIPRTARGSLTAEIAYVIDASVSLTNYGNLAFQLRSVPGAPLLIATQGGSAAGPGRLIATYDGYTFKEVWKDGTTYVERGLYHAVGPLDDGTILGHANRGASAGSPLTESERFTFTPAP